MEKNADRLVFLLHKIARFCNHASHIININLQKRCHYGLLGRRYGVCPLEGTTTLKWLGKRHLCPLTIQDQLVWCQSGEGPQRARMLAWEWLHCQVSVTSHPDAMTAGGAAGCLRNVACHGASRLPECRTGMWKTRWGSSQRILCCPGKRQIWDQLHQKLNKSAFSSTWPYKRLGLGWTLTWCCFKTISVLKSHLSVSSFATFLPLHFLVSFILLPCAPRGPSLL